MKTYFKKGMILLFWLGVWALLAVLVRNEILMVTPLQAFRELLRLLAERDFYLSVGRSLLRIGAGFAAGFAAAVFLAAVSYRLRLLEELLFPLMKCLTAIPVASFVVLLLIWWGASFLAVAICFLVVLPNIYVNTLTGLKAADENLLEMAKVFRLPLWNRFLYIYRPSLKPFLYSGMQISLGMCWKSGVAAEVIGTPDFSIGERLYLSKIYLNTAGVFAWTAVIILLSVAFERLVLWLTGYFWSWQPACRKPERHRRGDVEQRASKTSEISGVSENTEVQLRVSNLRKGFGEQVVLDGVSASYRSGQIYYLREPSGSGKTTLLKVLAGLLEPDEGSVEAPAAVSMMFQEDRLCEAYSAVKNVELVIGDGQKAAKALAELLEPETLEKPCAALSGGMKRRVALVRAMEADADFVLLDEPFTGMDAETRARAEAYIRSRQRGRTLIIATHI